MILHALLCAVAALIVIIAIYITAVEPYWFGITAIDVRSPRIPKEFDGKKMLFLSDIHTSKYGRLERTLAGCLKKAGSADICVITGDLMFKEACADALKKVTDSIDSLEGIYYVSGNSEYKPYVDHREMAEAYKRIGLVSLDNSSRTFTAGGGAVRLVGLDNFEECNKADFQKAFTGDGQDLYTVCLCHTPSCIDDILPYRPDLVLSGHTHGGQVRLPLFDIVYTHMDKNNDINGGVYSPEKLSSVLGTDAGRTMLIVSRGIGTSAIRIRFRCRPEIHMLTFYHES